MVAWAIVGCDKPRGLNPKQVDVSVVEIAADKQLVRHDIVGDGEFAGKATFVLVDARNRHSVDLDVTLSGDLVDDRGQVVGAVAPASLRVPKGRHRLFALVDDKQGHRPTATGARIKVTGAHEAEHPPAVRIKEFFAHPDGERMMVSGTVANTARGAVKTIVIGAFYDGDGVPMTRPYTVLQLDGDTTHPVHFKSEPGAKTGFLFIGQTVY